jgi:phosphate-selective porin OprO/OprP
MNSLLRFLAVAFASTLAGAPVHAAEAEAPASASDAEDRFQYDIGWGSGLRYRYESHLGGLDPKGVVFEGRIGGSLYLDGGWGRGDPLSPEGWTATVRRAHLYTSGSIGRQLRTEYKFEFAIEDSDFFLNDFYLRWRPDRFVDSVRFGYFDPPSSLQNLASSSARSLLEVAAPVSAFVTGYRLGLEVSGSAEDPSLTWFLNLSSVGQSQDEGDDSSQPLRLVGRLNWRPWGEAAPDRPLLHLGASVGWAPSTSGAHVQHRARPESYLVDHVVDTGEVNGANTLIGTEFIWRRGPLAVQSELLVSRLHGTDVGNPTFYGAYVETTLVLTGEVHEYDPTVGVLRRLVPKSPFQLRTGGTGAVEVAARLSWLDLSDADVDGGRLLTFSLGPAWTWNGNVRVLADWVVGRVTDRPEEGWLGICQMRLELLF